MIAGSRQPERAGRSPFVHLHVHSNYTLMSGANRVEEIVRAAGLLGFDAVALTDTNALHGAVPFYRACEAAGVKPIIGAEIELGGVRAVLLARDVEGYRALCRIVTARQLDDDFPMPHNPAAREAGRGVEAPQPVPKMTGWIEPWAHHVYVLTAHEGLLRALAVTGARESLFVELQYFGDYASRKRVESLGALANERGLRTVATNGVYFVEPEGHERHRLLTAIRRNTTLCALPDDDTVHPECCMKDFGEMLRLFHERPEAVRRARWIADRCNVRLELGRAHLPSFPVPTGETADAYLRRVALVGARKRYRRITPKVRERLDYELGVIARTGFAPYFLVVWDIAREAFRRGIPTVGRGSAANSIVSYCLGLTHVCPLRHNLFFERFLHLERKGCPDVDLDFCWRRRDEILEWVYDRYGHDRVAMICTFNTLGLRSSIREVAKVMGLLGDEISAFTRRLPYFHTGPIERIVAEVPECRDLPVGTEPWKTIGRLAGTIANFPRHLGTHAGGLVVAPQPVTDYLPLEYAAKGLVITQFDMHAVEDIGLVKIDLLGQRALSVIADVVEEVRRRTGAVLDVRNLEEGDPEPIAWWKRAETIGCFQVESPCMRGLLKKLHVDGLDILTAASSLVRPGPSDAGMTKQFIARYNGREKVRYLHPRLRPLLKETLGVMVYQEDVIKVVHELAGLGFGEAEMLRKSMSKKRGVEAVASYEKRFVRGAIERGLDAPIAQKIWEQIASFAGYAFCKAHSASYAQESYQSTWLKAHYPAAFMAAVLANGGGFYHAEVYVNEARRMGLRVLGPDVNESSAGWTGWDDWVRAGLEEVRGLTTGSVEAILEGRSHGPYASVEDLCARVEITKGEVENLVRAGAFDSLGRTRPQLLWECGPAFNDTKDDGSRRGCRAGRPRPAEAAKRRQGRRRQGPVAPSAPARAPADLRRAEGDPPYNAGASVTRLCRGVPLKSGTGKHSLVVAETPDLFYGCRAVGTATAAPDGLCDYTIGEKVRDEISLLGYSVTAHPMSLYQGRLRLIKIRDIERYAGRRVKVCGWFVTTRRTTTERGRQMRFLSVEDMTGVLETVLFPDAYARYGHLLATPGPYLLTGTVQNDHTHHTLTVEKVEVLSE